MKLIGAGGQGQRHFGFRADGVIATGGTPQLVLPETLSRSFLLVMNVSSGPLWIEFGSARAHCALSSGAVSTVTMDNVGFGFTMPPIVQFIGGFPGVTSSLVAAGRDTDQQVPTASYGGGRPAQGVAVLSSTTVASISITDGGAGYKAPPYVFISNRPQDPLGCADPSISSGSGILLGASGGSYYVNGTTCLTDAMAIYGATTNQAYTCMWMP